jgi:hypothetical protein
MSEQLLVISSRQFFHGFPQLCQRSLDSFSTRLASGGGMHAGAATGKQRHIEVALDGRNRLRDGGLRQMHFHGSGVDTAKRDDFEKSL